MLTREQNELLCRTDRGTPGGEWMRRYWQKVTINRLKSAPLSKIEKLHFDPITSNTDVA